jgi:hypothetical protein
LTVAGILGLALTGTSCSYAPSFDDGVLQCGDAGQCPKGYSCGSDNTCWKSGEEFLADYLGTWRFSAGTLNANCTDDLPFTRSLTSTDFIMVGSSRHGVVASYYCDWTLHAAGGSQNLAKLDPGQACTQMTSDLITGETFTYDWSSSAFDFSASGTSAEASGRIAGPFSNSNGGAGTCDVTFDGSLVKSSP